MMRLVLWIGAALPLGLLGCNVGTTDHITTDLIHIPATASGAPDASNRIPIISFDDTLAELGIITEGTEREHSYWFTNDGEAPLLLTDVSTSCGCTLAERWPRAPLQPGERGSIKIRFDSRGRVGTNHKEIYVVTNAVPSTTKLSLTAEVIGPH